MRCLWSKRLETRLVDITAVQEVAAEKWVTFSAQSQKNGSEQNARLRDRFMLWQRYTIRRTKNKMEDDCDEAVSLWLGWFFGVRGVIRRGQKP